MQIAKKLFTIKETRDSDSNKFYAFDTANRNRLKTGTANRNCLRTGTANRILLRTAAGDSQTNV